MSGELPSPSSGGCDWVEAFNRKFKHGSVSKKLVESPSNWNVAALNKLSLDYEKEVFTALCKFKWAFNIKPDVVIHADGIGTLCVEAKLESRVSSYPNNPTEIAIFDERFGKGKGRVNQLELQRFMFEEILEFENVTTALVHKGLKGAARSLDTAVVVKTWGDVLTSLKKTVLPPHMRGSVERAIGATSKNSDAMA